MTIQLYNNFMYLNFNIPTRKTNTLVVTNQYDCYSFMQTKTPNSQL